MSTIAASPPRKIYPLTSVRFFAAFFVVFHHSAGSFLSVFSGMGVDHAPNNLISRALFSVTFSVSFFFLLSGYVLGSVYLRGGRKVDKSRFFAARFARIYPLYLVVLVLDSPELWLMEIRQHGIVHGLAKSAGIFAANMVLIQAWMPEHLLRVNAPSWSLCGEVFFYACFPVLGVWLWKLRGVRLGIAALALYVGGQALVWVARAHLSHQAVLYLPVLHLSTFALGIVLARWQTLRKERRDSSAVRLWQVNAVFGLSVGGAVLSVLLRPMFHVEEPYNNGMLAPFFAGFIWALSAMPTQLSRWLCASWLVALGNASYGLYLIHFPVLLLFLRLGWVGPVFYLAYLSVCVGLSVLSFFYFETPMRVWLLEKFHTRSLEGTEEAAAAQ